MNPGKNPKKIPLPCFRPDCQSQARPSCNSVNDRMVGMDEDRSNIPAASSPANPPRLTDFVSVPVDAARATLFRSFPPTGRPLSRTRNKSTQDEPICASQSNARHNVAGERENSLPNAGKRRQSSPACRSHAHVVCAPDRFRQAADDFAEANAACQFCVPCGASA